MKFKFFLVSDEVFHESHIPWQIASGQILKFTQTEDAARHGRKRKAFFEEFFNHATFTNCSVSHDRLVKSSIKFFKGVCSSLEDVDESEKLNTNLGFEIDGVPIRMEISGSI